MSISLLTPTTNDRIIYFDRLIRCIEAQDYPLENIEWIILDDFFNPKLSEMVGSYKYIKYMSVDSKKNIGEKRNILNKMAQGDILINIDDDDYYPPNKISYVVDCFEKNPEYLISGSSCVYMYYDKEIYRVGPYGTSHATGNTLSYKKKYTENNFYRNVTYAEEKQFLRNYTTKLLQLPSIYSILVIRHTSNTANKAPLHKLRIVKENKMNIESFIKNKSICKLFL